MKAVAALSIAAGIAIGWCLPLRHPAVESSTQTLPSRPDHSSSQERAPSPLVIPAQLTKEWAEARARTNPQAFLQWLLKADPQPDAGLVCAFFHSWIAKDCDAAFSALLRLPGRFGFSLVEPHPWDTSEQARSLPNGGFVGEELVALLQRDPESALRWTARTDGILFTMNTMGLSWPDKAGADIDPVAMAAAFRNSPGHSLSPNFLSAYITDLVKTDPATARSFFEALDVNTQIGCVDTMMFYWARQEPQQALQYLQDAPSALRQRAALSVLPSAFDGHVEDGMKWLEEQMGVSSYSGLNNLLQKVVAKDPDRAVEMVSALDDPLERKDAAIGLGAASALMRNTGTTIGWLQTLPEDLRLPAATGAMNLRAEADFSPFLALMAEPGTLGADQLDEYARTLTHSLGRGPASWKRDDGTFSSDMTNTADWLRDHPGPGRDAFIRAAAGPLENQPELQKRLYAELPSGEVERVLSQGK